MAFNMTAIMELPSAQPPPGVAITFAEDVSFTHTCLIISIICLSIGVLTSAIRMYTKLFIMRNFVLEDYVFVSALAFFVVYVGLEFPTLGLGIHKQWNIKLGNLEAYLYWMYFQEIFYIFAANLIKVVILLQYIRLFAPLKRGRIYWICLVLIGIHVAYSTAAIIASIFQCTPVQKAWEPLLLISPEGHCINFSAAVVVAISIFQIQDMILMILPQCVIWKLNMSIRRKVGVSALFGVGALACIASTFRLVWAVKRIRSNDKIETTYQMSIWMMIESTCGIIIVTLPVFPRFYQHLVASQLGSWVKTSLSKTRSGSSQQYPPSEKTYVNSSHGSQVKQNSRSSVVCDEQCEFMEPEKTSSIVNPQGIIIMTRQWDVESQNQEAAESKKNAGFI